MAQSKAVELRALFDRAAGWVREHADGRGLPASDPLSRRVARAVTLIATLWFAGVGLWEIAAPFGAGHYASSAAVALGGENILRFGTLLPITHHPAGPPSTADAYCHHPFGIFWTSALFAFFGHHEWVCRLPAVLVSTLTVPLLGALGRALWSPLAGAIAAAAFVLTPIALSFNAMNSLEVPVIFGTVLASYAYVRFRQTSRRRFAALTVAALVYAVNSDWAAYVFAAALFLLVAARVLAPAAWASRFDLRRTLGLLGAAALAVALVGVAYVAGLASIDQLDNLWQQAGNRSRGVERPLADVLEQRSYWIALMFTPLAVAVGKLAAPVALARALARRTELEALPLAILGMAGFQYVVFKQGADIHVFWPHYFAPFFALGLALLGQTALELAAFVAARLRRSGRRVELAVRLVPFGLALAVPLLMARDAVTTLVYARKTGGRFNERGAFILPDKDKAAALELFSEEAATDAAVGLHPGMRPSLWVPWVLGRPARAMLPDAKGPLPRYYVADARFSTGLELASFLDAGRVTAIGPFWVVDRSLAPGPLAAYGIERREPSLLERAFVSSTHALREIEASPFATWELRDFAGQTPNPAPSARPSSLEELRIAHNAALAGGDAALAQRYRSELLGRLDRRTAVDYVDGTRLLGSHFEDGASDVLTVVLQAERSGDERFMVSSRIEEKMPGSLVPADELQWDVGLPPGLPRSSWKRGYLYSSVTEILERPGRERFFAWWASATHPLLTTRGTRETPLLVLP